MAGAENIVVFIFIGSLLFGLVACGFIIFLIQYQRRMHQKDAKLSAKTLAQQIEIFKSSSEAEEREKERISRNLHDEINPLLIVLQQNIERIALDIKKNKFDPKNLESNFQLIGKITEGLRTASYDLVPSFMLEFGLIKSLEDYVRDLDGSGKISAEIEVRNYEVESFFSKMELLNIYRICLELLNNTLKHSQCNKIHLKLFEKQQHLLVEVLHNGKGITNEEIHSISLQSSGQGLKSLTARVLILRAQIDYIDTPQTKGVILTIPYSQHEQAN